MNSIFEIILTLLFVILTVCIIFTGVWLLVKNLGKENGASYRRYLAILLLSGFIIRVACALLIVGNRYDVSFLKVAVSYLSKYGFSDYYSLYGVEIYPIAYYLFGVTGGIASLLGVAEGSIYFTFAIKLPLIFADILSAYLLYRIARRFVNSETGVILAAIIMLCPAFFIASAVWGAQIVLCMPLILLSLYLLIDKKDFAAIMTYSLAMLTAKEATFVFPLFLVYYGYYFVLAIREIISIRKNISENNRLTLQAILSNGKAKSIIVIPVAVFVAFLAQYLVALPLSVGSFGANPFVAIYNFFILPLASVNTFTFNGLSIFTVFGRNTEPLGEGFPIVAFTVAFAILAFFIVCLVYFSRKNRAATTLIAAYVFYTLFTYSFNTTPMQVVIVLPLIMTAFVFTKDRRLLSVMLFTALSVTLAGMSVLSNGNFLGSESATVSGGITLYEYASVTKGGAYVLLIASAVISVLSHLALTLVIFDITMNDNRKLLRINPDEKYFSAIKTLFVGDKK